MSTIVTNRYITRNNKILGGEPIIAGTRIPIRTIVEYWRLGLSPEEINEYIEKNRVTDDLIDPEFRESS